MAATTTKIGIVNRGLQLLGIQQISSLSDNSRGAKAMAAAYDPIFLAALRENTWNFSIKRANIAADATAPIFGKAKSYPCPGDFLFLAPEEPTYNQPNRRDWNIEGSNIISDDASPLHVRYVSSNITESAFDVLFAEALSYMLALATCEELTNSNTKQAALEGKLNDILNRAKKRNAIENTPRKMPPVSWIMVRQ